MRLPTAQVDEPARRLLVAVERPYRPGFGLVGASDEAVEPASRDEHIIVDEADVLGIHVGQRERPRLHRRDIVFRANERETALARAELEISLNGRWRRAIDVDE